MNKESLTKMFKRSEKFWREMPWWMKCPGPLYVPRKRK